MAVHRLLQRSRVPPRLGEFVASGVQVDGGVQNLPDYIRNLEAVVEAFPDYH
jgi:hypothetical protein